jgi:hypothetical protein
MGTDRTTKTYTQLRIAETLTGERNCRVLKLVAASANLQIQPSLLITIDMSFKFQQKSD